MKIFINIIIEITRQPVGTHSLADKNIINIIIIIIIIININATFACS